VETKPMKETAGVHLTLAEALRPVDGEPTPDMRAWQDAKVRSAIAAADAGHFASTEQVKAVVRKYVRHE
jgi:predicted transcriptional regulator